MKEEFGTLAISMDNHHIFFNEAAINNRAKGFIFQATTLEGNNRIAWLLKAITFIDLTTLGGDDTETNVKALCYKAVNPISLAFDFEKIRTAAVCVYPARVEDAVSALAEFNGQDVEVASGNKL
ncbi:deoxyribose-phosphate aldolase-like [Belonocnema kinseyi]|uniref:deoxyribose-phosphate aldolase-like n=1 Tax=Belonocnema kinseyi TaxID=2817044 RepID=UPI00143DD7F1|nr:deoxyribose-phosphate aldolase-like [Belonocnema kinseyi]